ncbi:MAG TPA: MarR family transcriptional regulator [Clostridiaceae bacterium]|nr:MarR family transcriptional regulator [Clostridiaceae bacterium]
MLKDDIHSIYLKLKLYYYRRIFRKMETKEKDSLTALETFCAEAIYGLGLPTLTEFADFINVSQPNAAYKIANLERKGFVKKIRSEEDGRVVLLQVTDKFIKLYGTSQRYSAILAKRIERRFSEEEIEVFHRIMQTLSEELMKEVNQYLVRRANLPKSVLKEHAQHTT